MNSCRIPIAFALFIATLLTFDIAFAERAPRSLEDLTKSATHIISGDVEAIFKRTETKGNFEYTFTLSEILVRKVDKGMDLKPNDRVFVKSYEKTWLGADDQKLDGEYGHNQVPGTGDSVEVYLSGNRQEGFSALYPNGYFKILQQKPDETSGK